MELQNAGLGQRPSDEESPSSAASPEHSARGKKYLKSRAAARGNLTLGEEKSLRSPGKNVRVQQQLGVDSDGEEMGELVGSSPEVSSGSEARKVIVSDSKWGGKVNADVAGLSVFIYTSMKLCYICGSLFI